jgi:hypothetical protein
MLTRPLDVFLFPLENTLELFVLWLAGAILYVTLFFIAEVPRQFSTSYGEKNLSLTSLPGAPGKPLGGAGGPARALPFAFSTKL